MQGMTQERWDAMTSADKDSRRSRDGLAPQLVGLEGCRVEVEDRYGEVRRFIVGRSTGWVPCHLEVKRRDSRGGMAAEKSYARVRVIERNVR